LKDKTEASNQPKPINHGLVGPINLSERPPLP
jgi:hypothetical protein